MKFRNNPERGASAVEMALVAPFLLLLLLGIIEFGYVFGTYNEVRHSVREGARVAAVSNEDLDQDGDLDFDADDIEAYVCANLGLSGGGTVTLTHTDTNSDSVLDIGELATITVAIGNTSLSGAPLVSSLVPSNLSNTATFVLEQEGTWAVPGAAHTCP